MCWCSVLVVCRSLFLVLMFVVCCLLFDVFVCGLLLVACLLLVVG